LSEELYVVFQVPDHEEVVADGAAVIATAAGAEGVTAAGVVEGVVTWVVPEVPVQPAAAIRIQMKPTRIITCNFFIKISDTFLFPAINPAGISAVVPGVFRIATGNG
jgi:hypothetical protein